jgi:RNA polymerase sigma factor (sigma-70 family)
MAGGRRKLLERLFVERAGPLHEFFRRRIRRGAEAPDLTQEVYLRMLRAPEGVSIDNPEAYLFTVANNLLRERAVIENRTLLREVAFDSATPLEQLREVPDHADDLDRAARSRDLLTALSELSTVVQRVVVWTYADGLTQDEIAHRLGVSRRMARKHLAAALEHCRRRMLRK